MNRAYFNIDSQYQPIFREIGLDADGVFTHPEIRVWRSIPDRENCTLDVSRASGGKVRFHIKRYSRAGWLGTPAEEETAGIRLLQSHDIPTAPLVGWGRLADGRNFVILEDLAGFRASDKLLEEGFPFLRLLERTADLAARLHEAGLHHRDLYLNHFFANPADDSAGLKLIDAARVRRLPWMFTGRWIVKDLAQFWYSTLSQPISDEQRLDWLRRYAAQRRIAEIGSLVQRIRRKTEWMARHDQVLNRKQPNRNVAIPKD